MVCVHFIVALMLHLFVLLDQREWHFARVCVCVIGELFCAEYHFDACLDWPLKLGNPLASAS